MNYNKVYNQIIENRKQNPVDSYTETHHIIPRSLGGTDEESNLVRLTAREHFLCHYLLAKMYEKESLEWYKMNNAFLIMKCTSLNQNRYFNSRLYEALRINFSSVMSKNQAGKGNSQHGTMWICNIELKENNRIKKEDPIPEGWIKGRNKWNSLYRENKKIKKKESSKKKRYEKNLEEAEYYWSLFIDGDYKSVRQFCDMVYPKSLVYLTKLWKEHIEDYKKNSTQGKSFISH